MKRIFLSIIAIAFTNLAQGQAPSNYYASATGTGYTLKTQLYNIIKNHRTITYGGLWDLYANNPLTFNDNWYDTSDRNKILDIYSEKPNEADSYTYTPRTNQCGNYSREGNCYNREHLIPQSVFNENSPMVTDAFHIWPTDGYVNGRRANLPFGVVGTATWTSSNGSKLGNNLNQGYSSGYSGQVFEPIDEFKGDIARAYFYFVTRYQENGIQNWDYVMFNGTKDKVFKDTFLSILMTWHENDPVSPREIALNNTIYTSQNNRNPFIDNPEYVQRIWGTDLNTSDYNIKEENSRLEIIKKTTNKFRIRLENEKDEIKSIKIYSVNGQFIKEIKDINSTKFVDFEITLKGIYIAEISTKSLIISKKFIN